MRLAVTVQRSLCWTMAWRSSYEVGSDGVEIIMLDYGMEIKQVAKDRQIFLSKVSACRTQLHESIRFDARREERYQGPHQQLQRQDLPAHLILVEWVTNKDWGVLPIGDWNQLMLHLDPSDEMRLGIEVLRRMLTEGNNNNIYLTIEWYSIAHTS